MVDEERMREKIKEIIARDDVEYIIGYEKGSYGARTSPGFAFDKGDADRLIFSPLCHNNLTVYLTMEDAAAGAEGEDSKKIGVVVKGCDSKALVQLIAEEGVERDDIIVLGVPCRGMIDPAKLEMVFPAQGEKVEAEEAGDDFVITRGGETRNIKREKLLMDKCLACENPNPIIYDLLLGEELEPEGKEEYSRMERVEDMSLEERWKYWEAQYDKCIRCYACRNVCPVCQCEECMAEQLDPRWLRRSVNISENAAWNIMWALHHAGRCVGCGECERACPMDIPLMALAKKVEKDVKEMFDYCPGVEPEKKPLLALFEPDDPDDFIM